MASSHGRCWVHSQPAAHAAPCGSKAATEKQSADGEKGWWRKGLTEKRADGEKGCSALAPGRAWERRRPCHSQLSPKFPSLVVSVPLFHRKLRSSLRGHPTSIGFQITGSQVRSLLVRRLSPVKALESPY